MSNSKLNFSHKTDLVYMKHEGIEYTWDVIILIAAPGVQVKPL